MQTQMYEKEFEFSSAAVRQCQKILVSAYKTVFDELPITVDLFKIVKRIQSDKYAELIAQIRNEVDKKTRQKLKIKLPAITASGIYHQKAAGEPYCTTGLLQIDIDELPTNTTVTQLRQVLMRDPFTFVMFTSPSGTGLKLLVRITTDREKFLGHFYALEKYYQFRYFIKIDEKCKNINRLCYLSHDPEIYVNAEALPYTKTEKAPVQYATKPKPKTEKGKMFDHPQVSRTRLHVERLIQVIDYYQVDITSDYTNWTKIGFALISVFADKGEDYFVRISRYYPGFSESNTRRKYQTLQNRTSRSSIGALFGIAADHGVMMRDDAVA